ncbi:unnamed protein product [Amoebophrya sp. A25]|nr:unnamed protein product [Amoebophrya sp. A25]|eukprot:GSA25T00006031001.1
MPEQFSGGGAVGALAEDFGGLTPEQGRIKELEAEVAQCKQTTKAALKAATAQILLLQRELATAHRNSDEYGVDSIQNVDEDELQELRKQIKHLELDAEYYQKLSASATADKDRLTLEVRNLTEAFQDAKEDIELLRQQLRHYELNADNTANTQAKIEQKLRKRVEDRNLELSHKVMRLTHIVSEQEVMANQYQARYLQSAHLIDAKRKQLDLANSRVAELKKMLRQYTEKEMHSTITGLRRAAANKPPQ